MGGGGVVVGGAHHEGVLHPDDVAVQDGGGHRGDLQHLAAPRLRLPGGKGLPAQVGHQLLDLLHLPFGVEGLRLVDGRLWHHHAGRAVLDLGEDLDRLACTGGGGNVCLENQHCMLYVLALNVRT